MRYAAAIFVVSSLLATPSPAQPAAEPSPKERMRAVMGALLQADGPRARAEIDALPETIDDAKLAATRTCVRGRLAPFAADATEEAQGFARDVLATYRAYWRLAVAHPDWRGQAESDLAAALARLLAVPAGTGIEAIEPLLQARLRAEGYHLINGVTGRLRDLILWRSEERRLFRVSLPEGVETTPVFLLDDFASRGWSFYMTCGVASTGGWAKPEALYAIVPGYESLEGEDFRVNFLTHETQHFADRRDYPGITSWELEYRAKLAELATAETTLAKTLAQFLANVGDDPEEAHSYANGRVVEAIRRALRLSAAAELKQVPAARIHAVAVKLLKADSRERRASH